MLYEQYGVDVGRSPGRAAGVGIDYSFSKTASKCRVCICVLLVTLREKFVALCRQHASGIFSVFFMNYVCMGVGECASSQATRVVCLLCETRETRAESHRRVTSIIIFFLGVSWICFILSYTWFT